MRTRPIDLWRDALTLLGAGLRRAPLVGPRVVQLNIADRCNLRCIMCNQSCFPPGGFLDPDRAISLTDELAALGLQELFWHGYGEPCLHPQLGDMIATVGRRHPALRQFTVSNGTCISETLVGILRDRDVGVRISAHAGDRETWARIHPQNDPGLFDRMVEATARLAEGRPGRTELLFALFETNRDRIDSMIRLARKTGVRRILFRHPWPRPRVPTRARRPTWSFRAPTMTTTMTMMPRPTMKRTKASRPSRRAAGSRAPALARWNGGPDRRMGVHQWRRSSRNAAFGSWLARSSASSRLAPS